MPEFREHFADVPPGGRGRLPRVALIEQGERVHPAGGVAETLVVHIGQRPAAPLVEQNIRLFSRSDDFQLLAELLRAVGRADIDVRKLTPRGQPPADGDHQYVGGPQIGHQFLVRVARR